MPQYLITSPEGKKYKVTAPEGATQEEVLSKVSSYSASKTVEPEPQQSSYFGAAKMGEDISTLPPGNDPTAIAKGIVPTLASPITAVENKLAGTLSESPLLSPENQGKMAGIVQTNRKATAELDTLKEKAPFLKGVQAATDVGVTLPAGGLAAWFTRGMNLLKGTVVGAAVSAPIAAAQSKFLTPTSSNGEQETPKQAVQNDARQSTNAALTSAVVAPLVTLGVGGAIAAPAAAKAVKETVGNFMGSKTAGMSSVAKDVANLAKDKGAGYIQDLKNSVGISQGVDAVPGYTPTATGITGDAGIATLETKARQANPIAFKEREQNVANLVEDKAKTGTEAINPLNIQQEAEKARGEYATTIKQLRTDIKDSKNSIADQVKAIDTVLEGQLQHLDNTNKLEIIDLHAKAGAVPTETKVGLPVKEGAGTYATKAQNAFFKNIKEVMEVKDTLYAKLKELPLLKTLRLPTQRLSTLPDTLFANNAVVKAQVENSPVIKSIQKLAEEKPNLSYEELNSLIDDATKHINGLYAVQTGSSAKAGASVGSELEAALTIKKELQKVRDELLDGVAKGNPELYDVITTPGKVAKDINEQFFVRPSGEDNVIETPLKAAWQDSKNKAAESTQFLDRLITGKEVDKDNITQFLGSFKNKGTVAEQAKNLGKTLPNEGREAEQAVDDYLYAKLAEESGGDIAKLEKLMEGKYLPSLLARPKVHNQVNDLLKAAVGKQTGNEALKSSLEAKIVSTKLTGKNDQILAKQAAARDKEFVTGFEGQKIAGKEAEIASTIEQSKSVPSYLAGKGTTNEQIVKNLSNPTKRKETLAYVDTLPEGRKTLQQSEIADTLNNAVDTVTSAGGKKVSTLNLNKYREQYNEDIINDLHGANTDVAQARKEINKIAQSEDTYNKLSTTASGSEALTREQVKAGVTLSALSAMSPATSNRAFTFVDKLLRKGYNDALVDVILNPNKALPAVLKEAEEIMAKQAAGVAMRPTNAKIINLSPITIEALHNMAVDNSKAKKKSEISGPLYTSRGGMDKKEPLKLDIKPLTK